MVTGLSKAWLGVNNTAQSIMLGESIADYGVHIFTIDRQSITTAPARHKDSYGYPENNGTIDETLVKLFYFNNSDILKYNKINIVASITDVSYSNSSTLYSGEGYKIHIIPPLSLERESNDVFTIPLTSDATEIDSSKPYSKFIKWSLYRRINDYGNSMGSYDTATSLSTSTYVLKTSSTIESTSRYTVTVSGLHIEVYGYI